GTLMGGWSAPPSSLKSRTRLHRHQERRGIFNALQDNIGLRFNGLSSACPLHGSHCSSAYRRGDARGAAPSCLCLDTRILRVEWYSLRLGSRTMGASSVARSPLG